MKIISVSVGRPKEVFFEGKKVLTSIFKAPITGGAEIGYLNLAGDRQSDLTVHGGRDKALYVYSYTYYNIWACEMGVVELEPAQFGENLTVANCIDSEIVIGSQFGVGTAICTVTQPRIPCFKLGVRFNDKSFTKTFWNKGRLGFYLRVDNEGRVRAGDSMKLLHEPEHNITVKQLWEIANQGTAIDADRALKELGYLDEGWIGRLKNIANKEHTNNRN